MIEVIAHRGISSAAEENTRPSFDLVIAHHLPIVEFDVQYTKDGIPVVFHDKNTQRMCGVDTSINECLFSQLPITRQGNHILSLTDVFEIFNHSATYMHVEIKDPLAAAATLEVIQRYDLQHQCLCSSFDHRVINDIRNTSNQRTMALFEHWNELKMSNQNADAFGVDFYSWKKSLPNHFIKFSHPLFAYTVNNSIDFSLARRYGFSGVYSDHPNQLMEHA